MVVDPKGKRPVEEEFMEFVHQMDTTNDEPNITKSSLNFDKMGLSKNDAGASSKDQTYLGQ